jgi:TolA-binding protein
MSASDRRQQLAEALSVTWTSTLETETKARIDGAITAARRRRKRMMKASVLLATICAGSLVFAFSGGISRNGEDGQPRRPAQPHVTAPPEPTAPEPAAAASGSAPESPGPAAAPPDRPAPRRTRPAVARQPASQTAASDPIEELFARADRARLAGFPDEALQPLTEIQERFPQDPRAAVAAFQLGRIFADVLRDPERAARAFDRAQALAPSGPLARDARTRAEEARRAAVATKPTPAPTP